MVQHRKDCVVASGGGADSIAECVAHVLTSREGCVLLHSMCSLALNNLLLNQNGESCAGVGLVERVFYGPFVMVHL